MTRKTTPDATGKLTPPLAPGLPVDEHEEELIDEALTETFPASDPIAVPRPDDLPQSSKSSTQRKATERTQRKPKSSKNDQS